MSRSFKHTPIVKEGGRGHHMKKRIANRRVRRMLNDEDCDIRPKSNDHRMMTESWEISDSVGRWSREQAVSYYFKQIAESELDGWRAEGAKKFVEDYPNLYKWMKDWEKMMLRK